MALIKSQDLETIVFDYSRESTPIKNGKSFRSLALSYLAPIRQSGNQAIRQRLYNVSVRLGMRAKSLKETKVTNKGYIF
ncbi:hypothetical protein N483_20155 [Pseudoalteromonas luteoviolacea NCIMB 1944]|nr:hypothetical protein N483_20155 [Pseudoalteromonas luteoviolacea NCIMB 1944]